MLKGYEIQGFEVVEIDVKTQIRGKKIVTIGKNRGQLFISTAVSKDLDWKDGDRLTLLKLGTTFALMPGKVNNRIGDLTVRRKNERYGYYLNGKTLCDKIYWAAGQVMTFEAWADKTDDGRTILFFKPEED